MASPIRNKQLVPQTRRRYTVGSLVSGAAQLPAGNAAATALLV